MEIFDFSLSDVWDYIEQNNIPLIFGLVMSILSTAVGTILGRFLNKWTVTAKFYLDTFFKWLTKYTHIIQLVVTLISTLLTWNYIWFGCISFLGFRVLLFFKRYTRKQVFIFLCSLIFGLIWFHGQIINDNRIKNNIIKTLENERNTAYSILNQINSVNNNQNLEYELMRDSINTLIHKIDSTLVQARNYSKLSMKQKKSLNQTTVNFSLSSGNDIDELLKKLRRTIQEKNKIIFQQKDSIASKQGEIERLELNARNLFLAAQRYKKSAESTEKKLKQSLQEFDSLSMADSISIRNLEDSIDQVSSFSDSINVILSTFINSIEKTDVSLFMRYKEGRRKESDILVGTDGLSTLHLKYLNKSKKLYLHFYLEPIHERYPKIKVVITDEDREVEKYNQTLVIDAKQDINIFDPRNLVVKPIELINPLKNGLHSLDIKSENNKSLLKNGPYRFNIKKR